jgi:hypothetical protein
MSGALTDSLVSSIKLQIMRKSFDEQRLIRFAYAFEQISMIREQMQPKVLPNTQLSNVFKIRLINKAKSVLQSSNVSIAEIHEMQGSRG